MAARSFSVGINPFFFKNLLRFEKSTHPRLKSSIALNAST